MAVEERLVQLRPAGRIRDGEPERDEDERGAGERDRDAAPAVAASVQAAEDLRAAVVVQGATSGRARRCW
jgi:hypothetical protein